MGTAVPFTPEAAAVYEQEIYPELNAITGHSINASKLFGRLTTNARKIAGILAVIAGEPAVSAGAIKAAAAWVRHGAATVNALASTVDERLKTARAHKDADAVLKALGKLGPGVLVPQRDLRRAAHLTAEQVTAGHWLPDRAGAVRDQDRGRDLRLWERAQARRPLIGLAQ